jgi:hypothetical protein
MTSGVCACRVSKPTLRLCGKLSSLTTFFVSSDIDLLSRPFPPAMAPALMHHSAAEEALPTVASEGARPRSVKDDCREVGAHLPVGGSLRVIFSRPISLGRHAMAELARAMGPDEESDRLIGGGGDVPCAESAALLELCVCVGGGGDEVMRSTP